MFSLFLYGSRKERIFPLLYLFLLNGIVAHPFDSVRVLSHSKFAITQKSISFDIKFPVHAYINLWVNSADEYDKYLQGFNKVKRKKELKNYLTGHIYLFENQTKVPMQRVKIEFQFEDKKPKFVRVQGLFKSSKKLSEIYLFNEIFKEGSAVHTGNAEIQYKGKVFDFVFTGRKYFYLKL